ncbi:MAG: DUF362 domain-containing protein [Calditrichaeota bacterium]|nr:MAG: DUF362 domain-containing protein [Calditrichota bacterium]
MENKNVSIVKCGSYEKEQVYRAVGKAVDEAGNFPEVKGKTVLLKPNLLYPVPPEKAVTTHPSIVEAVIRIVQERGAAVVKVGDSPGVASTDNAGRKSGVKDVVLAMEAEWVDFSEPTLIEYKDGLTQKQFYPAKVVAESDIIISIPKLKTHEMMYFTGAMKNLFGTIPGLNKSRFHFNFPDKENFASMIVDLNGALNADYAVMDAIVGMEGPGPGSGYPKHLGFVAASSNLLALDAACASIVGYDPEEIPIFQEALKRKLWLDGFEEIQYPSEQPDAVKPHNFKRVKVLKDTGFIKRILPGPVYKVIKDMYVPRPFFSKKKCIACGKCVEICPPDALVLKGKNKNKKAAVDYGKCIRCYCCHEVCPVDAIRIGRF